MRYAAGSLRPQRWWQGWGLAVGVVGEVCDSRAAADGPCSSVISTGGVLGGVVGTQPEPRT